MINRFRQIKRDLIKRHENVALVKKVLKYYDNRDNDRELAEHLDFIRSNKRYWKYLKKPEYAQSFILGGDWVSEYLKNEIDICFDEKENMNYVLYSGKKMYMKRGMDEAKILKYVRGILMEQDKRSAHCYFPKEPNLEGKIVVDCGTAEGNFALPYIEQIKELIMFETDEDWIEALEKTYQPWKDKVKIEKAFVGDGSENSVSLDSYFSGHQREIDLIKMDIEGAETAALKGSRQIISDNDDLTLLICLYHKGDDEKKIRGLLKEFDYDPRKGYVFFFWDMDFSPEYLRKGVAEFKKR